MGFYSKLAYGSQFLAEKTDTWLPRYVQNKHPVFKYQISKYESMQVKHEQKNRI